MIFKNIVYQGIIASTLLAFIPAVQAEVPVAQSADIDTIRNLSGAWFDYKQMGSGFNFVTMGDGKTFVYYYGYNKQGKPRWLLSEHPLGAVIPGEKQTLNMQYYPIMGAQGEDFADLEISFADCHNATANLVKQDGENKTYNLIPSFDNDSICIPVGQIAPPKKYTSELSGFNPAGVWYQPDHSGIGIHFIHAAERGNFAYFFGYDENDEQLWLLNRLHFNPFVKGIDQERDMRSFIEKEGDIKAIDWGKLILGFDQCDKGHLLLRSKDKITTRIDLNNMVLSAAVAGACRTGIDDRMTPPSKPTHPQKPKPKPPVVPTITAEVDFENGGGIKSVKCETNNDKIVCTATASTGGTDENKAKSAEWKIDNANAECEEGASVELICTLPIPKKDVNITARGDVTGNNVLKYDIKVQSTDTEDFTKIKCDPNKAQEGQKVTCSAEAKDNGENTAKEANFSTDTGDPKCEKNESNPFQCSFIAPANGVTMQNPTSGEGG